MGIDAFVFKYREGNPATFALDAVKEAFSACEQARMPEFGLLRLTFSDPPDSLDIFCDKDALETNRVRGLTISRPVTTHLP